MNLFHKVKSQIPKFYTAIATGIVVLMLFALQYLILEGNPGFFTDSSFWFNFGVVYAILLLINEIYWRNGSKRGNLDDKYISSAIEYSLRVDRIKNFTPCKIEDFYKYIDEKNIELFIDGRNKLLDQHGIMKDDYYLGSKLDSINEEGEKVPGKTKPHCEMSEEELRQLTRVFLGAERPYYSAKQIKIILKAVYGDFPHEILNGTEILSGIKDKHTKYAVSYSQTKNKMQFTVASLITVGVFSILGALMGVTINQDGWSIAALFTFFYRVFLVFWRAMVSDEAGYADIVVVKKGVNINRANLITMYATARNVNCFVGLNAEIQEARKQFIEPTILETKQEVIANGNRPQTDS